MLDVKNLYSLLSNSIYLSPLSDIITIHTKAFVMGHKVLYAPFIEVGCHKDDVNRKKHVHRILGQAGKFVEFLPQHMTYNTAPYCETLNKLWHVIQNKRRDMLSAEAVILHYNAHPHTNGLLH
jgi:hypothetical protein